MRVPLIALAAAACLLFPQRAARAWSASGHMAVAAIAYREMEPAARARIGRLLREHPHFASRWKAGVAASGLPWDEYLFMQASVWPDVIRGDAKWDHPAWHYINKVYAPEGSDFRPSAPENILTALDLNKRRAIQPGSAADRAVALCWVLHLMGDLHQPLHAATLVSPLYPTGDCGGNEFYVRTPEGPRKLHAYWDGLFDDAKTPREIDALAARVVEGRRRPDLLELETRTPGGWVEESLRLAVAAAYNHAPDPLHPYERVPLKPARTETEAAPLPAGYAVNARANAERRILLAGYRSAATLNGLLYGQP